METEGGMDFECLIRIIYNWYVKFFLPVSDVRVGLAKNWHLISSRNVTKGKI